jgi:hypothetical protein
MSARLCLLDLGPASRACGYGRAADTCAGTGRGHVLAIDPQTSTLFSYGQVQVLAIRKVLATLQHLNAAALTGRALTAARPGTLSRPAMPGVAAEARPQSQG